MTDTSHAFVRNAMLPAKEPPLTETGAVKWLRENLFSGWFNIDPDPARPVDHLEPVFRSAALVPERGLECLVAAGMPGHRGRARGRGRHRAPAGR